MALHSNQVIHKLSLLPAGMVYQFLKIKNSSIIKQIYSHGRTLLLDITYSLPSNVPWQIELRAKILHMQNFTCGEKASFRWESGQPESLSYVLQ